MVKRKGYPAAGELVIARVTNVNPHSAFAHLLEYKKDGMIHISEIRSGWVKDIKNHVKEGQQIIAKVLDIDKTKGHITLSLKRVDENQRNDKKKEYKLEQKAETMLKIAGKKKDKSLNQAYKEVGYNLQDKIGSLYKGFKAALNNEELLRKRGISKEWIDILKEVAEKNIEQKEFVFKAEVDLESFDGNGLEKIKSLLGEVKEKGILVKYIAAPRYRFVYKSKNAKAAEREFKEELDALETEAKSKGITADYKLIKT